MINLNKILSKKVGQPPGTLTYTGEAIQEKQEISLIKYDSKEFDSLDDFSPDNILSNVEQEKVNWINTDSLHDITAIEKLGAHFNIHNLVLEDILNTEHLPKFENFDDYIFFTLKMLKISDDNTISAENVNFIIGKDYLLSFQEKRGDLFNPVRERIREGKGKARVRKSDYLFYLLADKVVDYYFVVLETIRENIENIEDELINNPNKNLINDIHALKRLFVYVQRSIFPLREALNKLMKEESVLIQKSTITYLNDIYDHVLHLIDVYNSSRDMIMSLVELNMSNMNTSMNNIMKTLTVVASIFIPLTFMAGVYGMNFEFMPELTWKWAYPGLLIIMAAIGIGMYLFMKRKKWF